jgi:hypothetical protein
LRHATYRATLRDMRCALSLAITLAACASPPPVGPGVDGSVATDAPSAAIDSGEPDAGGPSGCPIVVSGECAPVDTAHVLPVVRAAGIHMPAGALAGPGPLEVVALAASYDDAALRMITTPDRITAGAPTIAIRGASDATTADTGATQAIYFVGAIGLERAERTAAGLGAASPVVLDGTDITPYWPQAIGLPDGRVLLAFVEPQARAFVAISDANGARFTVRPAPTAPPPLRGILAHVGLTAEGDWVLTHQSATETWAFTSFVQTSSDGLEWSEPIVVQPDDDNVHDAFPIARRDQGADLYYLRAGSPTELHAFRRALRADRTLGPEQRVTAPELGHVEKPQPRRLPDGRIALTFAQRIGDSDYHVLLAILDDDAPL